MARPRSLKPAYCLHKPSGRAFVKIDGRTIYLGRHGTQASRDRYDVTLAEWIARGRNSLPTVTDDSSTAQTITVAEVVAAFWNHAECYYRNPDGTPSPELDNFRHALRPLTRLYGDAEARNFGPLKLKAVREAMIRPATATDPKTKKTTIRPGWSRRYTNKQISRIKTVFKWAVEEEFIPSSIHHGLLAVGGLKYGKSAARETEPVKPVPEAHVDAVLSFLSRQVRTMVELEWLCGARPGEMCRMRTADIDTTAIVWTYTPPQHKTAYLGHKRVIRFGKRAQELLKPFLRPNLAEPIFSPADADTERRAKLGAARKVPIKYGNRPGTNRRRSPKRKPGSTYTTKTYCRAIGRACERAFLPPAPLAQLDDETVKAWRARLTPEQRDELRKWRRDHRWTPNQLRHAAATRWRRDHGIEMSQTLLGHRVGSAITEVYAEQNSEAAEAIMAKIG